MFGFTTLRAIYLINDWVFVFSPHPYQHLFAMETNLITFPAFLLIDSYADANTKSAAFSDPERRFFANTSAGQSVTIETRPLEMNCSAQYSLPNRSENARRGRAPQEKLI